MDHTQPPRRRRPEPAYWPPTGGHRVPPRHAHTRYAAQPGPYASGHDDGYDNPYADGYGTDHGPRPHPQDRIPTQRRAGTGRAATRRRTRWPIVVTCLVLVPLLGLVACIGLLGAGVQAVDDARRGGTVALGQSFRYASGVELAATPPRSYKAPNFFAVDRGNVAYESTVTITNGTTRPMSAVLVSMNATVAGTPAARVLDGAVLPTQDIAPGQQLNVPFRFQVPKGTTGSLQISVQDSVNEPVFFTGSL